MKKNPGRGGYLVGGKRSQGNLFEKLSKLKAYSVDVSISHNVTVVKKIFYYLNHSSKSPSYNHVIVFIIIHVQYIH